MPHLKFTSDLDAAYIPLMPLFVYLRGPAAGLNADEMARDCFRLGRVMVSWAVEWREGGGAAVVGVIRLDLARRFREAGREWRVRASSRAKHAQAAPLHGDMPFATRTTP